MRKETNNHEQTMENKQSLTAGRTGSNPGSAFEYLRDLPNRNLDRPVLRCFPIDRDSNTIESEIAETFTTTFREATNETPFTIPISWTMTKESLINLLGITSYVDYSEVNGIRFYAGVNCDNQLTLVAVSTTAGDSCNDDLTVDDDYPYYDYADPCPTNCSRRGNLKTESAASLTVAVVPKS